MDNGGPVDSAEGLGAVPEGRVPSVAARVGRVDRVLVADQDSAAAPADQAGRAPSAGARAGKADRPRSTVALAGKAGRAGKDTVAAKAGRPRSVAPADRVVLGVRVDRVVLVAVPATKPAVLVARVAKRFHRIPRSRNLCVDPRAATTLSPLFA